MTPAARHAHHDKPDDREPDNAGNRGTIAIAHVIDAAHDIADRPPAWPVTSGAT